MALLPHNIEAYKACKKTLIKHNECCFVAATGVGKSNVATELIQEFNLNTLVIAPTRLIKENWSNMIAKYNLPPIISTVSYKMFSEHWKDFIGFDMYIFDECHHAGSSVWGKAIRLFKESLHNGEYILGLTADPIRYLDYKAENKNVAETVFNGHVVYGHDQKSAINQGILPNANYVCALYDVNEYVESYEKMYMTQELRGRLNYCKANCESIEVIARRHAPKGVPIKGIVFVDNIDTTYIGIDLIKRCFPDLSVYTVHSNIHYSINIDTMNEFERSESGFIVAVDMISEGMHFSGINVIILLRRTVSPTLYNQQIGRGLSSNGQDIVIYDFVRNDVSVKKTLDSIELLYSNRDDFEYGSGGSKPVSRQIIINDYTTDIISVLSDIEKYNKYLNSRKWSESEDDILKELYPKLGPKVSEKLPGRTAKSCKARAEVLGISMYTATKWTDEEDNILKEFYPSMGINVASKLPGRTKAACKSRAFILGIVYTNSSAWTKEEDEILKKYYPVIGSKVIDKLPGRSKAACIHHAKDLGISVVSSEWTKDEDDIIKNFYDKLGMNIASMLPGRTKDACMARAVLLGVAKNIQKWTKEEDEILREYYPDIGANVVDRLPGRTRIACKSRAKSLGLYCASAPNKWTDKEDNILREYYPKIGYKVSTMIPNRTKSACIRRATRDLGLQYTP